MASCGLTLFVTRTIRWLNAGLWYGTVLYVLCQVPVALQYEYSVYVFTCTASVHVRFS